MISDHSDGSDGLIPPPPGEGDRSAQRWGGGGTATFREITACTRPPLPPDGRDPCQTIQTIQTVFFVHDRAATPPLPSPATSVYP